MAIVGLADQSVAESKERVRAALASIGLAMPPKRIAVNLSPADVVKEGAHFDLPIAVGLLVAMGVLPADSVADCLILGELSLAAAENADELLHNRDEIAEPAVELLKSAIAKRHLTARGFFRVLKVARTIANLAATRQIQRDHIAEALAYRMMLLLA